MPELDRILREIKETKKEGRDRLYIARDIESSTVMELRNMGYIVLQTFSDGYVDTIVGWKKYD